MHVTHNSVWMLVLSMPLSLCARAAAGGTPSMGLSQPAQLRLTVKLRLGGQPSMPRDGGWSVNNLLSTAKGQAHRGTIPVTRLQQKDKEILRPGSQGGRGRQGCLSVSWACSETPCTHGHVIKQAAHLSAMSSGCLLTLTIFPSLRVVSL